MKQYATLGDTIYFWFAGNDTSGSGGDGATPLADVRLAGAAAGAAPVFSPTPVLLTDAGYPAGCYELAVAATAGNGCAANNTYAVFCTLAIDSQNPTGFIGSVDLKPVLANAKQLNGTNQTGRDIGANVLLSPGTGTGQLDFTSGVVKSNLAQILGTALTETAGYIAAGFKKLFNIQTPVLTMESVNQSANNNTILAHGTYGSSALQVLIAALQTNLNNGTDGLGALKVLIDTNKSELDGLQGTDGKVLISTDAQDLSGSFDVNTKTATATALDLILEDSIFALAIKDAIWNAILTGATFNIANSAGRRVREIGAFAIESGTAQSGTLNSIKLAVTANDEAGVLNRNLIVLTDNIGKGQTRTIVDYDAITKVAIVDRDWRVIPDNTTAYQVVPDDTPLIVDHGVAQGGTSTTIEIREYASSNNNAYWCNIVAILAGKGRGQARLVGSYNGTSKVITICGEDWVEIPDTTSVYVMMPYGTTCTSCLSASALALINTEVDNALNTVIPGSPTAGSINEKIKALPSGIAKNVALNAFTFYMVLSSDHVSAATGKTLTGQISKDGGAFAGLTNSITEIGNGLYKVDIIQAEMNADVVTLKFTETDCDQRVLAIYTS